MERVNTTSPLLPFLPGRGSSSSARPGWIRIRTRTAIGPTSTGGSATVSNLTTLGPPIDQPDPVVAFISHNILLVVLGAAIVLTVFAISVWGIVRCKRKTRKRKGYTSLDEYLLAEESRADFIDNIERSSKRDGALLNCQFYLRSSSTYILIDQLPDVGSRAGKYWFEVQNVKTKSRRLLTTQHCPLTIPVPFDPPTNAAVNKLYAALQHPNIQPIDEIDFVYEQNQIVTVQEILKQGSLRDHLSKTKYNLDWQGKKIRTLGKLQVHEIQVYGRQILQGLMFLEEQGFPPFPDLHSGNVLMQGNTCRISGLENIIIGCQPKLWHALENVTKTSREAVDVICFGHLIYEMSTGLELKFASPTHADYCLIQDIELEKILHFIFDDPLGYPTLQKIADHRFFAKVKLQKGQEIYKVAMSEEVKQLIQHIKAGKEEKRRSRRTEEMFPAPSSHRSRHREKKRKKKSHRRSTDIDPKEPRPINGREYPLVEAPVQFRGRIHSDASQTPQQEALPSLPVAPVHRQNSSASSRSSGSVKIKKSKKKNKEDDTTVEQNTSGKLAGKTALFSDIRSFKFSSLKRTSTDDRSAPKV